MTRATNIISIRPYSAPTTGRSTSMISLEQDIAQSVKRGMDFASFLDRIGKPKSTEEAGAVETQPLRGNQRKDGQ